MQNNQENKDYTKHYIYEPNSFVPVLQTGYSSFIKLIETPDYTRFKTEPYSIYKDAVWKTDTRKNKAELERVAFYHCDQVGTPQTLSNEKGECIWEIELNTWGKTQQVKAQHQEQVLEQTNIRFQGQYYDEETGLHYNRYRYYEPHSGRYLSKDPIGLEGGLNNSAYVSDPNQWIDPMGLMGDTEKNAADYKRYSKEFDPYYAKEKADDTRELTQQKAAREVSKIKDVRYEQQNRPSTGLLGTLMPGTMSSLTKNKEDANVLRNRQGMRNVGTVGALVATAPYAITNEGAVLGQSAISAGIKGTFSTGLKAPLMGATGSAGIDGVFQGADMIRCKCVSSYSFKRTVISAGVGAFTAGNGATLARNSGVEFVTIANIHKNLANKASMNIFYGQTAANIGISTTLKNEPKMKLEDPK